MEVVATASGSICKVSLSHFKTFYAVFVRVLIFGSFSLLANFGGDQKTALAASRDLTGVLPMYEQDKIKNFQR